MKGAIGVVAVGPGTFVANAILVAVAVEAAYTDPGCRNALTRIGTAFGTFGPFGAARAAVTGDSAGSTIGERQTTVHRASAIGVRLAIRAHTAGRSAGCAAFVFVDRVAVIAHLRIIDDAVAAEREHTVGATCVGDRIGVG
jgi:hypothetical protein